MAILVKDIMSKPVITIDENKNARDAGKIMKKVRRGFLLVTRKGKPIGAISDSDLIKNVIVANKKASQVKLKKIMTRPLITVRPDDDILVAVRKMKKNNVHRLPVVSEEGRPVGVISLTDIAKTSPEMLDLLEYRLKMKEMPFEIKETYTSGICDSCLNYSDKLTNYDDQWLCESCMDELET
ncbi:MAG: CBS domain-containing protein [Candidatus Omnitrophica bacterium]|nr:CBS domain-containing protein [Candidatus Omnitrophota bacterium]